MDDDDKADVDRPSLTSYPTMSSSSLVKSEFLDDFPLESRLDLAVDSHQRVKDEEDDVEVDSDAVKFRILNLLELTDNYHYPHLESNLILLSLGSLLVLGHVTY